jgi:ketosteroid isomerase-like protein
MTMKALTIRFAFAALAAAMPALAAAQTAGLTIEQRLQRVEDQLAIQRILINYHAYLDGRNIEGYVSLFAKDGEWVNGSLVRKGPAQIRELLTGLFGNTPPGWVNTESYTHTTNMQIDLNGDRATARSRHLLVKRGSDGSPIPTLAGRYEDELIREDGQWKILRRVDYPVLPTAEEWGRIMQARRAAAAAAAEKPKEQK